jgi:2-oxoglutarate/2-oxoacid ferredoxin oxidoreductase subunit alpha
MTMNIDLTQRSAERRRRVSMTPEVDFVRIRFAGDSGDGIQLTGTRLAASTAHFGNDFATFPDFPAEIRAPTGTTYGVSAYSINIGHTEVLTAGDNPDVLVALNPAALKVNLGDVREAGLIIADEGTFNDKNFRKAGYHTNPLDDGTLARFRVLRLDISRLTLNAVSGQGLSQKDALRCKNMWTLGLVLWMFGRDIALVEAWLTAKFSATPEVMNANVAALRAGHAFGETAELGESIRRFDIPAAPQEPGTYRTVTGSETLAWGLYAGARLANLDLFFGSYPITPASPVLHALSRMKRHGVVTFQAEDEIAAVCAAIGASYGGAIGVTTSSGPGIALKMEGIGLAISAELPLVVVNVQRGGPSTGLPTKTEQADLLQAIFGRNGDTQLPVVAAATPADCFACAIEAVRLAVTHMTPVMLLSDGYIANAAEPWKLPDKEDLDPFPARFRSDPEGFHPYLRDPETLARPWVRPGTPGLQHRIGGLEKDYDSGNISYDPANHQRMTDARTGKLRKIAAAMAPQAIDQGEAQGDLAVVGWGSTYGAIRVAVGRARARGQRVSHIHIRNVWPLPPNLGELLGGFGKVLVPELNTGQLAMLLRSELLIDVTPYGKVAGQPFKVSEMTAAIAANLE